MSALRDGMAAYESALHHALETRGLPTDIGAAFRDAHSRTPADRAQACNRVREAQLEAHRHSRSGK